MGLTNECVWRKLTVLGCWVTWMNATIPKWSCIPIEQYTKSIQCVWRWWAKCWCYLFFPLCCCCAALCWLIQLRMVRLHHGIHTRKWMRVRVSKHRTNANSVGQKNIDRRLDTFRLVCSFVPSFVWLFHCCYFSLPRETEECVLFFPFAGSNSISISSFIGVWAWLLCM